METSRREVLAAGAILSAMAATGAMAQSESGGKGQMEVIRIFADANGDSHFEKVSVAGMPKAIPVTHVSANFMKPGVEDWHTVPTKLFTINVSGDLVGELSDGTKVDIGKGDLVYLEDTTGRGHVTHLLTGVANLFLQVPDDFDFFVWANSEPAEGALQR